MQPESSFLTSTPALGLLLKRSLNFESPGWKPSWKTSGPVGMASWQVLSDLSFWECKIQKHQKLSH